MVGMHIFVPGDDQLLTNKRLHKEGLFLTGRLVREQFTKIPIAQQDAEQLHRQPIDGQSAVVLTFLLSNLFQADRQFIQILVVYFGHFGLIFAFSNEFGRCSKDLGVIENC